MGDTLHPQKEEKHLSQQQGCEAFFPSPWLLTPTPLPLPAFPAPTYPPHQQGRKWGCGAESLCLWALSPVASTSLVSLRSTNSIPHARPGFNLSLLWPEPLQWLPVSGSPCPSAWSTMSSGLFFPYPSEYLCACVHSYMHAGMHTHIHNMHTCIHIHVYIHMYMHTFMHTHIRL